MKESAAFFVDTIQGVQGSQYSNKPELPDGFQVSIFKGKVKEGSHRVCDQFVHNSLID